MIPCSSPTSPYCQLPRKIKNFVVLLALLSQHALPLWGPPTSTLSDVRVRAGHEGSRLRMSRVVQARARVVLTTSLTLALRAAVKRQQTEEIGSPLASNTFPDSPSFFMLLLTPPVGSGEGGEDGEPHTTPPPHTHTFRPFGKSHFFLSTEVHEYNIHATFRLLETTEETGSAGRSLIPFHYNDL